MKKHFYLFSTVLLAATIFLSAPAKAENRNSPQGNNCDNNQPQGNDNKQVQSPEQSKTSTVATSNTQLPINNGIVFLMVAGVVIGITTVSKSKVAALKA